MEYNIISVQRKTIIMKKLMISAAISAMNLCTTSCKKKYMELTPLDKLTEAQYFKTPEHFKYATNDLYEKMISWQKIDESNIYDFMDLGSDLSGEVSTTQANYGRGVVVVPSDDKYWN